MARTATVRKGHSMVTPREKDLISLVGVGLRNKEIAARLGIAESTVKTYMAALMSRHHIDGRFALVQWARERGLDTGQLSSFQKAQALILQGEFTVAESLDLLALIAQKARDAGPGRD